MLLGEERSARIAQIFTGVPQDEFEQTAREMPLMPGAVEAVVGLRSLGYKVGIITDSYLVVSEIVRRRVFADFSIANLMRFQDRLATGQFVPSPFYSHPHGRQEHRHCKLNALRHFTEGLELSPLQFLAVGDGLNDVCLLRAAGLSVAFQPKHRTVIEAADHVLYEDLSLLPELARETLAVDMA